MILTSSSAPLQGQAFTALGGLRPNLEGNIERPIRYRPDGSDFVIENGAEFFNRPLYGGNTAFRVDAGDKPEFVLYLPGRGGNLRFGLRRADIVRWLIDAAAITTRYRPGEMHYEVRDPWLGTQAVLHLAVIALPQTEGLIARVEATGTVPGQLELVWMYGGINGQRGRRDGDIGTEEVPISEWFQFRPEFCTGNVITTDGNIFTVHAPVATIAGVVFGAPQLEVVEAARWQAAASPTSGALPPVEAAAVEAPDPALQVLFGRTPLRAHEPILLALQRVGDTSATSGELQTYRDVTAGAVRPAPAGPNLLPPFAAHELPEVFAEATRHFAALRKQIAVDTPDPYLNAAVAALNVAADAVWDEPQGVVMHGAIAWRTRLLGWRGPYAMDALGWHDRARRHFAYWATRQNTDPIPAELPPPDENANLARSEAALHSNGDMSNSHYDMNLVAIDALFRHLLWTGDREFAREMWPVIQRHLAWERRMFRREFGEERLPLYEAYAAIWASDDIQYHGGGVTYTSAYNQWHNQMAAHVARWLGEDPMSYEVEAALIARAMRAHLWLPEQGMFAEFRDLLGRQRAHPSAGLWSYYHPIDSRVVTPAEAWLMSRYVDASLPRLPVRGPGVPADDDYGVYATTNWMPYSWSVNNVVMGENAHAALAYWQAGRGDTAFRLLKSALLASMYMGICPGNIGSMNYLDVYRRESQRDFADGSGVLSRAIVEGLFGIQPDAIAGELVVTPGFPSTWERASLATPEVALAFTGDALRSHYRVRSSLPHVKHVKLRIPALRERVRSATINGREVEARIDADELGRVWLDVAWELAEDENEVAIEWSGMPVLLATDEIDFVAGVPRRPSTTYRAGIAAVAATESSPGTAFEMVSLEPFFNDRVTEIFRPGKYRSPRSPYVSLAIPAQGIGAWAGHVNASAEIDDSGLRRIAGEHGGRFTLPNGVVFQTPGPGDAANICFVSLWDNYPDEVTLQLAGRASQLHLLMTGSTNHMQSHLDNGEIVVTYTDGSHERLALHNPTNWWPIEQDYFLDDYQFRRPGPIPPRVDLRTGRVRLLNPEAFKGQGGLVPGGAATVLMLALDPARDLQSLTVRALANEVVIGLMAATLAR